MSGISKQIQVSATNFEQLFTTGEVQLWRNIETSQLEDNPFQLQSGEYILCDVEGLDIIIVCRVTKDTLYRNWDITDEEAQTKNYKSAGALKTCYQSNYYPNIDFEMDVLVVIYLEIAKIQGVATIKSKTPK